jgi:hypothetical protein
MKTVVLPPKPQLGDVHAEQARAGVAHHEVALGADPELALAVRTDIGEAGVRLDIALVRRLGLEGALDDDVGLLEAGRDIAMAELVAAHDVGGLLGLRLHAVGEDGAVQDRRAGLHRLVDVGHVRQHFVVDLDQLQGFARRARIHRRDRGDGMALIQRLLARHDVVENVVEPGIAVGVILEVVAGHDRLHAGQLLGLGGVDLPDARVGVRRAQDAANQHAGRGGIGAEPGAARHLVDAVGAQRAAADDLEVALVLLGAVEWHVQALRISCAASMTARTILS